MAQFFSIHPTHPQKRLVRQAADIVRRGGLIAYPTDSCYALGCDRGDAQGAERLRRIRGIDERHHLTLMCRDLVRDRALRDRGRRAVQAAEERDAGQLHLHPARAARGAAPPDDRKKTIGVRVPGHPVAHALLAELDEPMLSATLLLPGDADAAVRSAGDPRSDWSTSSTS